ncbi:hypothetical protein [Bacillus toyonensis]|uniref:hypothetical protein n=1 Tax=Bacillus toyonensis TaxID=155322 RepID=UPI000BF89D24|nr:hypothetical protein [Bacillus toyonensis]PGF05197.1 hypothetical protein COM61_01895 [Bacillus toyonensis]
MSVENTTTNVEETPMFVTINGNKLKLVKDCEFVTGDYAVKLLEEGQELINPENNDVVYYQEYCGKGIIYRNGIESELDMDFIETKYWLYNPKKKWVGSYE